MAASHQRLVNETASYQNSFMTGSLRLCKCEEFTEPDQIDGYPPRPTPSGLFPRGQFTRPTFHVRFKVYSHPRTGDTFEFQIEYLLDPQNFHSNSTLNDFISVIILANLFSVHLA
jgi:hypothetical protein